MQSLSPGNALPSFVGKYRVSSRSNHVSRSFPATKLIPIPAILCLYFFLAFFLPSFLAFFHPHIHLILLISVLSNFTLWFAFVDLVSLPHIKQLVEVIC